MIYLIVIGVIFAAEYKIRAWINESYLTKSKKSVAKGKLFIRNVHNKGFCGGYGKKHPEEVKTVSALFLGGVITRFLSVLFRKGNRVAKLGNAMILGGGLSNYYERKEKGSVTDYLSLNTGKRKIDKFVFNLADFCIVAGTFLAMVAMLLPKKRK